MKGDEKELTQNELKRGEKRRRGQPVGGKKIKEIRNIGDLLYHHHPPTTTLQLTVKNEIAKKEKEEAQKGEI